MRLVIHQALKDVRLLRAILVAWVGLNVALHVLVLVGASVYAPGTERATTLEVAFNVLVGLNVAGFVAVAVLVLQSDPALSTSAFWVTRPVSIPILLAAKTLVLVATLVALPALCDVLTLLAAGVPASWTATFVPGSLTLQLAWLLPVMALAAMTTTLAQFAVATAAEVVGFGLLTTAMTWIIGWQRANLIYKASYYAVTIGIVLLASLAVIAIAYGRRRLRQTVIVASAWPVLMIAAFAVWPIVPRAEAAPSTPKVAVRPAAVALMIGQTHRIANGVVAVTSIQPTDDGCKITVRWSGPATGIRAPVSYDLETSTGPVGSAAWFEHPAPFRSEYIPVPQHLAVRLSTLTFHFTQSSPPDVQTWLRGAKLRVAEVR
jgi:hypothetical protein